MDREVERLGAHHDLTPAQLEAAIEAGMLPLLALDRALQPDRPHYALDDLIARTGADPDLARRLWRAMGFPDVPAEARSFTDADAAALALAVETLDAADHGQIVQRTRVISSAMARIAESVADEIAANVRDARAAGLDEATITAQIAPVDRELERLDSILLYVFRRQLRAAVWRRLALGRDDTGAVHLAVGFVDLVGFTAATRELEEIDLASLVGRFESVAYDTVADAGGRVIKTIGDEMLFAAPEPDTAVRIALAIIGAVDGDESLPSARGGIDYGPVLARDGDVHGPVVNAAARAVDRARPGTVLVTEAVHDRLADRADLEWRSLGLHRLKGLGGVRLWRVRSAGGSS